MSKKSGFTLIELSIALIIIGLISAGVVIGRDMIRQSNITLMMSQVNQIKYSVAQFKEIYKALPGDISDSSQGVTSSLVGNGNGLIDDIVNPEQIYFWLHLSNADLYQGNFTGLLADQYRIAVKGRSGGVPASPIEGVGYSIVPNNATGVMLMVSKYNATSNGNGAFTPAEVLSLDRKFDDGIPNSGWINGIDGADAPANSCITITGEYNSATTTESCAIRFLIDPLPQDVVASSVLTCDGSNLGSTRISSSDACPWGSVGNVIEECVATSAVTASWENTQYNCSRTQCSGNRETGEITTVPCPYGWTGNITLTCSAGGVYSIDSSGCTINSSDPCKRTDSDQSETTRNLSCPLGKTGYVTQTCYSPATTWTTVTNACSTQLTCTGSVAIGSTDITSNLGCSNANYTPIATLNPICILSSEPSSVALANPMHSMCMPNYGNGSCVPNSTRDIGCATGYTGSHLQRCNSAGYYETTSNTCSLTKCGAEPIGSIKLSKNFSCNLKETGFVYDVCQNTGTYTPHYNCTTRRCVATTTLNSNSGFGAYATQLAHGSYSASACSGGTYTNNIANPMGAYPATTSRRCGFDGSWQGRDLPCFGASCPALNVANTTTASSGLNYYMEWPLTTAAEHGSYKVVTMTQPGNSVSAPRCNTNFPTSPQDREITSDAKIICSAKGVWVDFCSTAATNSTYDSRVQAISSKTNTNLPAGRIMDETSTPIEFWNDGTSSSTNYMTNTNQNFCDGKNTTSTQEQCLTCIDDTCVE